MPTPTTTDPQFLLVTEIAAIARVSVGTVRHWIATGKLPSVKPGRRVMVRRSVFQRFLSGAERAPQGGASRGRKPRQSVARGSRA